jgi:C4-dicarboxylate-binding protein DctP
VIYNHWGRKTTRLNPMTYSAEGNEVLTKRRIEETACTVLSGTLNNHERRLQKMSTQKKIGIGEGVMVVVCLLVASFICYSAPTLAAERIVIKYAHGYATKHLRETTAQKFKELAEKYTQDRVTLQSFPASQLYNEKEAFEACIRGDIAMASPNGGILTNYDKELVAHVLPLAGTSLDFREWAEFEDGPGGQAQLRRLEAKGVKGVGWVSQGYGINLTRKPIRDVKDFKGLKIRISESPVQVDYWKALGVEPTSIPASEVITALQQGLLDGVNGSPLASYTSKWHEFAKYGALSSDYGSYVIYVFNATWWNKLPPDIRAILETKVIPETMAWSRTMAWEEDKMALQKLGQALTTVTRLTDDPKMLHELLDKTEKVWNKWASDVSPTVIKELPSVKKGLRPLPPR